MPVYPGAPKPQVKPQSSRSSRRNFGLDAGYAEAISRGDIDEAVQGYAPDGVRASPTTEDALGHQAIAAVLRTTTADLELVFQTVQIDSVWAGSLEVANPEAVTLPEVPCLSCPA